MPSRSAEESPTRPRSVVITLLLAYAYCLWFSVVFQGTLAATGLVSAVGVRNSLLYSLCWLCIPALFPRQMKPLMLLAGLILWPGMAVMLGYFFIYRQEMSQGALFAMFASNTGEIGEFLQQYVRAWMVVALMVATAVPLWCWRRLRPVALPPSGRALLMALALLPLAEPFAKYWSGWNSATWDKATSRMLGRLESVTPWQLMIAWAGFERNRDAVERFMAQVDDIAALQPVKRAGGPSRQTFLLVLGESTTRDRMGVYGYPRDTTPVLSAMADQLKIYRDVVSPRAFTIEALGDVLTFADQRRPDRVFDTHNIMSLMQAAGFKTWWITNQQTVSDRNTVLTAFAQQADHPVYLNNNRLQSSTLLDDVVIEPTARALDDPAPLKFIVVHLMGAHFGYHHRYPAGHDFFHDTPGFLAPLEDRDIEDYNAYDNAVRYNDQVVGRLLKTFHDKTTYGAAVFFSDHGEEAQQRRAISGRDELNPTPSMYTVPFVLTATDRYRSAHPGMFDDKALSRPWTTEHFMHAWCDLSGVQVADYRPSLSVFNPYFVPGPRLVGNPASRKSLRDFNVWRPQGLPADDRRVALGVTMPDGLAKGASVTN